MRIVRRHHIYGVGDVEWEEATKDEGPTCGQQDFGPQETEIERHMLGDALYDANTKRTGIAIHEMADDRPQDPDEWELRECLNVLLARGGLYPVRIFLE